MAKLYFYYSAMNAGKTTTLLQSSYNYKERGMNVLLFTPKIDTRHKVGTIHSRIGLSADATVFDAGFDFFSHIEDVLKAKAISCVLLDEAQFLTKLQVRQLADVAALLGVPVLTYGLRSDFLGEPFPGSQYLLVWAHELVEIKTVCHCGRKATMNARVDQNGKMVIKGRQVEIGGNDRYVSLCYRHFRQAKVKA